VGINMEWIDGMPYHPECARGSHWQQTHVQVSPQPGLTEDDVRRIIREELSKTKEAK
jgi:hypothetical protein